MTLKIVAATVKKVGKFPSEAEAVIHDQRDGLQETTATYVPNMTTQRHEHRHEHIHELQETTATYVPNMTIQFTTHNW